MSSLGSAGCRVHRLFASNVGARVVPSGKADIAVRISIAKIDVDIVVYTRVRASKQQARLLALSRSLSKYSPKPYPWGQSVRGS